ncbi:LysR family transcriptional regulator [Burkholderia multivorans]|nr:LysR family transcriptional regulator [Burkholderia multivorans]
MPLADERSAPLTVTAPVAFREDIPRALRAGCTLLVHRAGRRR